MKMITKRCLLIVTGVLCLNNAIADGSHFVVVQQGSNNASIESSGDGNDVFLTQTGEAIDSNISLDADYTSLNVGQVGSASSRLDIAVQGSGNAIAAYQNNVHHDHASIRVTGHDNTTIANQTGNQESTVSVMLEGDDNSLVFNQSGATENSISADVNGNGNQANAVQAGDANNLNIIQTNDNNMANVAQLGSGKTLTITQTGNGLPVNVTQF